MKIIDAESENGGRVAFWLKLGWTDVPYAAIQFGMFAGPEGSSKTNAEFVDFVKERIRSIKARGATHALLFHQGVLAIALAIDDVAVAYEEQMQQFPTTARNTKSPTMWFFDPRPSAKPELTAIVMRRAIPLEVLAMRSDATADEAEARSRMAQVEARIVQAAFRNRVGERCGWRCSVTGSAIRQTLDAAHLPGRDWRKHNEASDGILVRADIHRLIDAGLISIEGGIVRVHGDAKSEYGAFDGINVN
ncbi:MAG: HNH endonuclease [Betaproteobacteria bacterium]